VARYLEDPITIALAVLVDRIRRLPTEDRNDLFELVQELSKAESDEDIDGIYLSMREILAQEVPKARPLDLASDEEPEPGLRKWIDFISTRVRSAREAAGMTQVELAERSGLPQSHISRIENGKLSPSRATLEKLARGLDRPLSDLDPSA
jgi:ribosome-binding protein aMBF1 (putative translation factor)